MAPITVERISERASATITLDRPEKKNALSVELRDAVTAALQDLAVDPTVNSVVITGAGDVFSAGFDLDEFALAANDQRFDAELWESSDRFHRALLTFPLPLVAAINGPALAGGFDLAVCCDVRIASTTARFAHPEFNFGDVVYAPLHEIVGGAVARDLALTGRPVDAEEALALRLVSQLVAPADLAGAVAATTARIAGAPRDRLIRTKAKALARAGIEPGPTLDL